MRNLKDLPSRIKEDMMPRDFFQPATEHKDIVLIDPPRSGKRSS